VDLSDGVDRLCDGAGDAKGCDVRKDHRTRLREGAFCFGGRVIFAVIRCSGGSPAPTCPSSASPV
jgi:hypothetical protein